MKRAFAILALGALLLGCASTRMVPAEDEMVKQEQELEAYKGLRITGYALVDGSHHAFHGYVRPTRSGDELLFRPTPRWPNESKPAADSSFTLLRKDVTAVQVEKIHKVWTALLAVGVLVAGLYVLAITHHPSIVTTW